MSTDEKKTHERHRRIRFTKALLRPLPRRATLHRYPFVRFFARAARTRSYLWSFHSPSMRPAIYAGAVLALMPTYGFQIPIAFGAAFIVRGNLATLVGLQFITNPLTLAPIYYGTYIVGTFLIGLFDQDHPATLIGRTAYGLVLGGAVCGFLLGAILDIIYRLLRHEAEKRDWHLPRRPSRTENASPAPADVQKP